MVNDPEWQQWLSQQWVVVPALHCVPPDEADTPAGWVIVGEGDEALHTAPQLGPLYEDEETARHIARCHNWWLGSVRPEPPEEDRDNTKPPQSRAPVP